MDRRSTASRIASSPVSQRDATSSGPLWQAKKSRGSLAAFVARLVAALVMGLLLLALSGLLHTAAAAATIGAGWSYIWATWLIAVIATLLIAFGAPTGRIAWGRLCALNGLASAGVLLVSTVVALQERQKVFGGLADQAVSLGFARPIGAALGAALLSAALGIAALFLAVVLLGVSFGLLHPSARAGRGQ